MFPPGIETEFNQSAFSCHIQIAIRLKHKVAVIRIFGRHTFNFIYLMNLISFNNQPNFEF